MKRLYYWDLCAAIFILSCLSLLFLPTLPSDFCWFFLASVLLVLTLIRVVICKAILMLFILGLLGFLWSTAYAKQYLDILMPYIDKTMKVTAKVESINHHEESAETVPYYVKFTISAINDRELPYSFPINVFWQMADRPLAGQIWQLTLKTKVVHDYLNEGGFDKERFAIVNRNLLTAKVIQSICLESEINIKQFIVNKVLLHIKPLSQQGILFALAFGDRSMISAEQRNILKQTGIAHLMAISGMHILLVYFISYFLSKGLLFFVPSRINSYVIPMLFAWSCAVFYAWLTGLNPPTIRAIIALSFLIYLKLSRQSLSAWQKLIRIIALLLFFDPIMILSESFWLSCYAIICLIFLSEWLPLSGKLKVKKRWYFFRLMHLQLGLTILFLPIQIFIFQGISIASLFSNLLVIPIISFITFPAIIIGLLFSMTDLFFISHMFWLIAQQSLEHLFWGLNYINIGWLTLSNQHLALSCLGWLAIIMWRTRLWQQFSITLILLVFGMLTFLVKQKEYNWRIDMLDVGHGLIMVIQDGDSAILYDTGASWTTTTAAEKILLPFIQFHHLTIDGIIISHQHDDHIGGLTVLQSLYPNAWLMSSSLQLDNNYQCKAGNTVNWKNLTVKVLWPIKMVDFAGNADSCIIKISIGNFSILLTGDLEKPQEYQLIELYGTFLKSTLLQVPHHGSRTSSSYAFLNAVQPAISLISVARYNPWHLPAKSIIKRYHELQLNSYITGDLGQISVLINEGNWTLKTMRENINHRWYHNGLGAPFNYQ